MTQQDAEEVFLGWVGKSHYLLSTDDLLHLTELQDNAGRPLVRVIDHERCELMGVAVEPWRCLMPSMAARARDLWVWRLDDIERPGWLPDVDLGLDSLSED